MVRQFLFVFLGAAALSAHEARAQAWVDEESSLSVGLSYVLGHSSTLNESEGKSLPERIVTHHSVVLDLSYTTPLPGLELEASLPFLAVKWSKSDQMLDGQPEAQPHGPWDDESYHLTLTDLRLGARYMIIGEPIAVSAGVAGSIPTNDYPTQGLAAAGRGLKALHLNASIGATFDPVLPNLYAESSYEFSLVERFDSGSEDTSDINQNRSDISARIGYFILEELQINIGADISLAHDGIDFVKYGTYSAIVQQNHDALLRENIFLVGGGASYALTEFLTVNASVRFFVGGTNTQDTNLFGAGLNWVVF